MLLTAIGGNSKMELTIGKWKIKNLQSIAIAIIDRRRKMRSQSSGMHARVKEGNVVHHPRREMRKSWPEETQAGGCARKSRQTRV